ncbi:uncharacterized protein L969DRAFT_90602 [Mixia osmundae IAM 14324]|uniref:Large ribosomal subunit protein uL11m n=1 Tax=Mixia osmundae (strain CBS 9802 / IAM 14324 / JCM 22182 / KY 12970) TaxID=764103 RepID=G7E1G3_MIXOS|nr:uncharacterized protein L969DRAFT_90602 [Mixia osmundae IAM 14324]KEI36627.1 hypothetical protein L969DRAFT_90602 [Mixia osmundae IAM 14324]GAA96673.1 hypothetical protein E5Q_03344 [Mixia osmundae IAM 14324]
MATKAAQRVRLIVGGGRATPAPPIGPALGSRGLKAADFCKEFNARTAHLEPGIPTPVILTIQPDRTFTFTIKTPPTSYFLLKAAGVNIGSGATPAGRQLFDTAKDIASSGQVGQVTLKHIYEIARIKSTDDHLKHVPIQSLATSVLGSCRSMGIRVVR